MTGKLRMIARAGLALGLGVGGVILAPRWAAAEGGPTAHGHGFAPTENGDGARGHHGRTDGATTTSTSATAAVAPPEGTDASTSEPEHGPPSATNHHKGGALTVPASTTCQLRGKVTFTPALKTGGTTASTVTVTGVLTRCSATHHHGPGIENGHLAGLTGSIAQNDCATFMSNTAPALAGGTIAWTPRAKVASSTGLSVPAGTGSTVTVGSRSAIAVTYTGGSVAGGSFANTGGTSLTLTSIQNVNQLSGRCGTGLHDAAFSGTISL